MSLHGRRVICLIGAAYPGSGAPMDKSRIPRDLFGIFWISLAIVISGQVFKFFCPDKAGLFVYCKRYFIDFF